MPRTAPATADRLRADLERWHAERDLRRLHFYTREQWRARNEKVCRDAVLTAVIEESDLFAILNFGWGAEGDAIVEDLSDFLASRGYWFEHGYAWSLHFYLLHPEGAHERDG